MSVTTRGALPLEGVGGQADRPQEIRPLGQVLADGRVLLVQREMAGDQGQHAAGFQGVDRFGEEVIMQREPLAVVVELDVGEGHVADHGVDAALGQPGVAEILDADVGSGVEGAGDAAGDAVQLDADEPQPRRYGVPILLMPCDPRHPFTALQVAGEGRGLRSRARQLLRSLQINAI